MNGWQAHIHQPLDPLTTHLVIYRDEPDGRSRQISQLSDGPPTNTMVDPGTQGVSLRLQSEWLVPLRDALIVATGPLPSTAEIRRLEEALRIERDRVAMVLNRLLDQTTTT